MSVHLVEVAAEVQLTPSLKLALLCFADSGSTDGRVARPGLDNLMRWTGLKRSRALEVVKHLEELQLLAPHRKAHRGQRAEYVVFPNGCCERHGKVPALTIVAADVDDGPLTSDNTAVSTGSAQPDPFSGEGPAACIAKGPILGEKGSDPEPVKGPGVALKSGALQEIAPSTDLQEIAPSGTDRQPLTPRETTAVSIEFVDPLPARGVRVVTPSGTPLGCRHCDAGQITDADGMPVAKCPHCHPAVRRSEGRTA